MPCMPCPTLSSFHLADRPDPSRSRTFSHFALRTTGTSHLLRTYFALRTSHFALRTSHFALRASHFATFAREYIRDGGRSSSSSSSGACTLCGAAVVRSVVRRSVARRRRARDAQRSATPHAALSIVQRRCLLRCLYLLRCRLLLLLRCLVCIRCKLCVLCRVVFSSEFGVCERRQRVHPRASNVRPGASCFKRSRSRSRRRSSSDDGGVDVCRHQLCSGSWFSHALRRAVFRAVRRFVRRAFCVVVVVFRPDARCGPRWRSYAAVEPGVGRAGWWCGSGRAWSGRGRVAACVCAQEPARRHREPAPGTAAPHPAPLCACTLLTM